MFILSIDDDGALSGLASKTVTEYKLKQIQDYLPKHRRPLGEIWNNFNYMRNRYDMRMEK